MGQGHQVRTSVPLGAAYIGDPLARQQPSISGTFRPNLGSYDQRGMSSPYQGASTQGPIGVSSYLYRNTTSRGAIGNGPNPVRGYIPQELTPFGDINPSGLIL